jgi:hypothetical protein
MSAEITVGHLEDPIFKTSGSGSWSCDKYGNCFPKFSLAVFFLKDVPVLQRLFMYQKVSISGIYLHTQKLRYSDISGSGHLRPDLNY